MKQTLLLLFMVAISTSIFSQDLFFSEYVEGSGNNKALEIYNPTASDISLSDYSIVRYSNGYTGPAKPKYTVALTGTIASHATWVGVLDKRDPAGTGQDTMVAADLQAKADAFLSPNYGVNSTFYFNGNDALTLEKSNGVYVDIIGEMGVDPGVSWTMDAASGYTSVGGAKWWTKNHTLIRKSSITAGVTSNPTPFIVGTEWDSLPINTFSYLGSHPHNIGFDNPVKRNNDCFFYPNPSSTGYFMVKGTAIITSVEVINVVGGIVISQENPVARGDMKIETNGLDNGIYFVNVFFNDGTSTTKKVIIK